MATGGTAIFAILHWLYFSNPEVATRLTQLVNAPLLFLVEYFEF